MAQKQQTIRVEIRAPDAARRAQLAEALASDAAINIADADGSQPDITLVHADALPGARPPPLEMLHGSRVVVACAPDDPVELAGLLASGVRGYHCDREPWSKLREILHLVHGGAVRADPEPMNELLLMYGRMLREASWREAQATVQPNGRK